MAKPGYFGSSSRPLFGIHEPPREGARDAGVLLCYPGVQEYNMAHWAFRRLSGILAREGFHVLRFDWSGTGDSWGETTAGTVDAWVDDVRAAADELREASGAASLAIVGMRLGATLAALACVHHIAPEQLLLWEPVVAGKRYVAELEALDARENRHLLHGGPRPRDELVGFPFPADLRAAIEAIDLRVAPPRRARRVAVVASDERQDYLGLRHALAGAGLPVSFDAVPEDAGSTNAGLHGAALLATRSLSVITDRLCAREPRPTAPSESRAHSL